MACPSVRICVTRDRADFPALMQRQTACCRVSSTFVRAKEMGWTGPPHRFEECRGYEQLESFLALEQRGRWCAVGLVDITGFKWYNDALGHTVGDRIIERVAALLREQVRSDDLLAQERGLHLSQDRGPRSKDLHARFGGDEFCFLIPDLAACHEAHAIGERFREAVERYDWTQEDGRLAVQPVHVDVGVVCLWLGRVAERRFVARRLAADLIQRADKLMYEAKGERSSHIHLVRAQLADGEVVDMLDEDAPAVEDAQG